MSRRCWTCNTDHDLDEACAKSMRGASVVAAGGRLADDFFDAPNPKPPVITAAFDSEDACCGNGIEVGDRIRSDGEGGWVHEDCEDAA